MQAITLAQQIHDGQIAIVGTGLPLIGASVAKRLYAPKCNLIVESGLMDCSPIEVPRDTAPFLRSRAVCAAVRWESSAATPAFAKTAITSFHLPFSL